MSPFGASTVNITGGCGKDALTLSFTFALTDGDTLAASGHGVPGSDSISGNATVSGGTGVFKLLSR